MTGSRFTLVCVPCRRTAKAERTGSLHQRGSVTCTECGQPMQNMGTHFRPPKRRNLKAWKRLATGDRLTETSALDVASRARLVYRWVRGRRVLVDLRGPR